jgi:hypothetical protein
MSYDIQCETLARSFLSDHPAIDADVYAPKIAQAIQAVIEGEIEEIEGATQKPVSPLLSWSMTANEWEQQRRSFAYRNANISNPAVTRKMIDDAAESEASNV